MLERDQPLSEERLTSINSVAILGLGQVGQLFLQELIAGPKVYGIGRKRQQASLTGRFPDLSFSTKIEEEICQNSQVIILAVPNPADEALGEIAEAISRNAFSQPIIVLPQNGVDVIPKAKKAFKNTGVNPKIVRASLFTAVRQNSKSGEIKYRKEKLKIALAPVSEQDISSVDKVSGLCQRAGFRVEMCSEYKSMEWTKLLLNTIGATGTITSLPPTETFKDKELFLIEIQAIQDRMRILEAAGIPIINFPNLQIPTNLLSQIVARAPRRLLVLFRNQIAKAIASERGHFPPSSARRIATGKPTEVYYYHRPFIDLGEKLGLSSPIDEVICALVKRHENREFDLREISVKERREMLLMNLSF